MTKHGFKVFQNIIEHLSTIYMSHEIYLFVCLMVFNATFNNISVLSWRLIFIGGGNWRTRRKPPVASHRQLYNVVHLALIEIWTHNISGDRNWCSCEPHVKYQLKWDIQHILYFLHWQEYRIYLYDILYFLHWQSTEFFFTTFFIFYIDRVQNLSLRHCGITNKGAELIGQTIGSIKKSNTKLISLNLSGNKISDAGAEHIAMVSYCIYQYSHVWQNLCYSKDNVKLLYLQIYLFFCCIFQHLYLKNIKQM